MNFILQTTNNPTFSHHCQWHFDGFTISEWLFLLFLFTYWYSSTADVVHFFIINYRAFLAFNVNALFLVIHVYDCDLNHHKKEFEINKRCRCHAASRFFFFLHLYSFFDRIMNKKPGFHGTWSAQSRWTLNMRNINDQTIHWLHNSSWIDSTKRCVYQQLMLLNAYRER